MDESRLHFFSDRSVLNVDLSHSPLFGIVRMPKAFKTNSTHTGEEGSPTGTLVSGGSEVVPPRGPERLRIRIGCIETGFFLRRNVTTAALLLFRRK
jgi:hypothetical protein